MSTTTNVQNLITTVFRPTYYYDSTSNVFVPHVEMSNVDTYIGNEVRVFRAQVGDSSNNTYVGVGAGNSYSNTLSGNSNLTVLGVNAGGATNNVTNSIYVGTSAGNAASSSDSVIAIGVSAIAGGSNNIFVGNSTGNAGSNNILIGHNLQPASTVSNQLNINGFVYGDFSNRWLGVGTSSRAYGSLTSLDVAGGLYVSGKIGVQMQPYNSLNVNGVTQSTGGVYSSAGSNTVGSNASINIGTLGDGSSVSALGNVLMSVQDITTPGSNSETGMYFCANVTGAPIKLTSNASNGYAHIAFSTSNIQISNSDTTPRLLYWSITYFPLSP